MNRAKAIKYYNQGVEYYDKGQFELALECFNQAIKENPKLVEAYNNRGAIYFDQLKQYEQALSDFNQVIKLNPKDAEAYYNRGNVYSELKQYKQALSDYEQAIKENPKYAGAYNNRGLAYCKLKQYEKALNDYNQAIKLNPKFAVAYNNRGNVYSELKQYEQALNNYNQAINLNLKTLAVYNNRGAAYSKLKQYKQALSDYEQAIKENPKYAGAYNNYGSVYIELKQYNEARINYDKCIELTDLKEDKKLFASLYYSIFLTRQQFELAEYYAHKVFEYSENTEELYKEIYFDNIEKGREILRKNKELEEAYLLLKEDYKAEIEENRRFKYLSATASDIVHQINQPIGAMRLEITGARQRIIDGKFKPERINPLLERVFEQLERLNNIITQFRSYANGKIERNQMNLNDIVIKILSRFKSEFPDHSIKLIDILETPAPFAMVNAFLLGEVLFNLLNNAKDALENIDNSTIWIKTWQTSDGRNGIDIEDNGAGVSPDVLEKLFLPFSTTKTAQKGLGLGLFLSRTNIEKLGGELTYKPRENGGSCFSICFLNTSKKELEHEQTI